MKRLLTLSALLAAIAVAWMLNPHRESVAAPVNEEAPEIVEESMHEFMEYYFQPTYRRLKASMAKEPADSKGWKPIKADSLILAEGGNLLLGRAPAKGGDGWKAHSVAVRQHGGKFYKAAQAKNWKEARAHYESMLTHCNKCHQQFAKGKYQLKP